MFERNSIIKCFLSSKSNPNTKRLNNSAIVYIFQCSCHRYQKTKNRFLKVFYVPATSTGLPKLLFLMQPLTVPMKQTRQAGHAIKQSKLLRCLWFLVIENTKPFSFSVSLDNFATPVVCILSGYFQHAFGPKIVSSFSFNIKESTVNRALGGATYPG
jgi:hypothetical protein